MDIKIEGNPGTGNTFQEFNIGHVENFNQGSTVFSNHNGDRKKGPSSVADDTRVDLQLRQAEILEYVCRLKPLSPGSGRTAMSPRGGIFSPFRKWPPRSTTRASSMTPPSTATSWPTLYI